ncbi:fused MFS/spermidine synthase [Sorangium sp. So ce296]|uniref:fused MFS/spermidine synthase n=1 Tax=Sorangium sp. So ce296 TaxID=3133296 RepID=UPI003F605FB3
MPSQTLATKLAAPDAEQQKAQATEPWLFPVFFLSGSAALVYQVVWQRALYAIYGVDILSITVVVTAFMLGLGLGSLAGGALSRRHPRAAVTLFAIAELGIGLYGALSLRLFALIAGVTHGIGHVAAGGVAFLLVVPPVMLMGATLPLLVGHATSRSHNVGRSLGNLYFANTLGAAFGAFLAARFLLGGLGLRATTEVAATLNVLLGVLVMALRRRRRGEP